MESNALIFIIVVFFSCIIIVMFTYYEFFKKTRCSQLNTENCRKLEEKQYIPILQRQTHLEDQFDNEPYSLFRDYFDQNSPWIGTLWTHASENKGDENTGSQNVDFSKMT